MRESGEMYLETILVLGRKQPVVRAIDVVEEMSFSRASVSRALSRLRADNCVTVDKAGHIALTNKGYEIASKIYERHQVLSKVLMDLGVDEQTALDDACRIEHVISDKSFEVIKDTCRRAAEKAAAEK